jgi:ferrochelatase
MKIEDILNLTEGELANTPAVHAVEAATVYPSKVEQGDLFFSSDQEEIDKAVANGAYAVVYDNDDIVRKDDEIAWIRVPDVQKAAIRLLRYVALKKEAKFYLLRPHELSFLKQIVTNKSSVSIIPSDWRKAFETVVNSDAFLFVSDEEDFMRAVKPDAQHLEKEAKGYVVSDTLFRTTFKIDEFIYQEKELVPFHLEHLLRVTAFAKTHELPYDIDRIRYTRHFQPVFIDGNLNTAYRGTSDKAVIFVDNLDDIEQARDYIRHSQQWIKSITLTPPKTKLPWNERPVWFEDETQLRDILKHTFFNYAFVYNADKSILKTFKEEYSLF